MTFCGDRQGARLLELGMTRSAQMSSDQDPDGYFDSRAPPIWQVGYLYSSRVCSWGIVTCNMEEYKIIRETDYWNFPSQKMTSKNHKHSNSTNLAHQEKKILECIAYAASLYAMAKRVDPDNELVYNIGSCSLDLNSRAATFRVPRSRLRYRRKG